MLSCTAYCAHNDTDIVKVFPEWDFLSVSTTLGGTSSPPLSPRYTEDANHMILFSVYARSFPTLCHMSESVDGATAASSAGDALCAGRGGGGSSSFKLALAKLNLNLSWSVAD